MMVGIFGTSGRPGSVGRLDNRLVCVRFLTQNRKSNCSENRNRGSMCAFYSLSRREDCYVAPTAIHVSYR
jgi:hypothetical protein